MNSTIQRLILFWYNARAVDLFFCKRVQNRSIVISSRVCAVMARIHSPLPPLTLQCSLYACMCTNLSNVYFELREREKGLVSYTPVGKYVSPSLVTYIGKHVIPETLCKRSCVHIQLYSIYMYITKKQSSSADSQSSSADSLSSSFNHHQLIRYLHHHGSTQKNFSCFSCTRPWQWCRAHSLLLFLEIDKKSLSQ